MLYFKHNFHAQLVNTKKRKYERVIWLSDCLVSQGVGPGSITRYNFWVVNYKCKTVYVLICKRITAKLLMKFACCKKQHSAWKWVLLKFLCSSRWRIFHSYGDLTIAGEGMQALTYARHFWPFFSVPYQLWHGESGESRGNGHFRGPVTQLLPSVW